MSAARAFLRETLALPLDEQRARLLGAYQATYDAYGSDWSFNTAAFAPDYVGRIEGTPSVPGIPREWSGREGYLAVHRSFREVLNVARIETDDVIPLGDDRVVALIRFVIRAGDSEFDQQTLDWHEFRDGELVLQRIWLDREEGLRDLGLSR